MDEFERLATHEELDKEKDPTMGNLYEEIAEHGRFGEGGGELSKSDWEDAVAR